MLIAQKDIICTPYRIKTNDPAIVRYTLPPFEDNGKYVPILPGGLSRNPSGPRRNDDD